MKLTALQRIIRNSRKHRVGRTGDGYIIWSVPIKHIQRSEERYAYYRGFFKPKFHGNPEYVNELRRVVRRNPEELEPIELQVKQYPHKTFKYALLDGHHRLTAHQAEGKKRIRAIIYKKEANHDLSRDL